MITKMIASFIIAKEQASFGYLAYNNPYSGCKELLHHIRTATDETRKTLGLGATYSNQALQMLAKRIIFCSRGCGAFFDGGPHGSSKPCETHMARGTYLPRAATNRHTF